MFWRVRQKLRRMSFLSVPCMPCLRIFWDWLHVGEESFLRGSRVKSLAKVSFGKDFISAVWCPCLKNENEESMKKVFILSFDALVAWVWSLRTWIFSIKNTIFWSIRFASRLLMDELTGFGWLARSKKTTPPLRGYPILSKAISTSWDYRDKMLTFVADNNKTARNSVRWEVKYLGRSKHAWASRGLLAKPLKKFPKSPIRLAGSHFWQAPKSTV